MNIETQLHVELQSELEKLGGMQIGTEEYKTTVDGVTKLMDRAIEMEKLNMAGQDNNMKLTQMEEDRKNRFVQNCLAVAGLVVPTLVTIWGTKASFKFEQEGTVTTIMGRGFINKLLPKK